LKEQPAEIIRKRYRTPYTYHRKATPSNIEEVVMNYHYIQRWNEKVGPELTKSVWFPDINSNLTKKSIRV